MHIINHRYAPVTRWIVVWVDNHYKTIGYYLTKELILDADFKKSYMFKNRQEANEIMEEMIIRDNGMFPHGKFYIGQINLLTFHNTKKCIL